MTITLAIPRLFDAVAARFALEGVNVVNSFGWRAPGQQSNQGRRIVWVPGDPSGSLGAIMPAKYPGLGRPNRPLAGLEELVTVHVYGLDEALPEDERAQYQGTRELFDAWYRAVYLAAHGTFRVVSASWIGTRKERRYGTGIRVVLAVQAVVPDAAPNIATAPVDTGAAITVDELDQTETVLITPSV